MHIQWYQEWWNWPLSTAKLFSASFYLVTRSAKLFLWWCPTARGLWIVDIDEASDVLHLKNGGRKERVHSFCLWENIEGKRNEEYSGSMPKDETRIWFSTPASIHALRASRCSWMWAFRRGIVLLSAKQELSLRARNPAHSTITVGVGFVFAWRPQLRGFSFGLDDNPVVEIV